MFLFIRVSRALLLLARRTIRPSSSDPWIRWSLASAAVVPCSFGARLLDCLEITDRTSWTDHRAMVRTIANDAPVHELAGDPETTPRCLLEEFTNALSRAADSVRLFILSHLLRMKVAVFWCNRVRIPQTIKI